MRGLGLVMKSVSPQFNGVDFLITHKPPISSYSTLSLEGGGGYALEFLNLKHTTLWNTEYLTKRDRLFILEVN